jgi:hypothetical protein
MYTLRSLLCLLQGIYITSSALAALAASNAALVAAGLEAPIRPTPEGLPPASLLEIFVSALRYCIPSGIARLNRRQESSPSPPTDTYVNVLLRDFCDCFSEASGTLACFLQLSCERLVHQRGCAAMSLPEVDLCLPRY